MISLSLESVEKTNCLSHSSDSSYIFCISSLFAGSTFLGGIDKASPPLVNTPSFITPRGLASNIYFLVDSPFVLTPTSILKFSIIAIRTTLSLSAILKYEPTFSFSSATEKSSKLSTEILTLFGYTAITSALIFSSMF